MDQPEDRTDKPTLPMVAIDGTRARVIRETKKLTQLYVASVVGVTTDTISRWENNRYPSIKRDNAEKLASALEVELAEILRDEEPAPEAGPVARPAAPKPARRWWPLAIGLVLLAGVAGLLVVRTAATPPSASRALPRFTAPGELVPVRIFITGLAGDGTGLIVKESLPPGWQLVAASPATATPQGPVSEVKWLLPGGSDRQVIHYLARAAAPPSPQQTAPFTGTLRSQAGGTASRVAIAADTAVTVSDRHWADTNGDGRIDDDEIMPAYYLCEEMKGLGLDWKTIEAIWSGTGYRWQGIGKGFAVLR